MVSSVGINFFTCTDDMDSTYEEMNLFRYQL